jgi:diguanylate cyclase (GGDEF)-like protein
VESPILLIENDPYTAKEIAEILFESGYQSIIKDSLQEAERCLQDMSFKVIIQSNEYQQEEQLNFIEKLKSEQTTRWIPLIIISDTNNDSFRIECFNRGVDDFLLKPVKPIELIARVKGWISRVGNLEEMAFRDPLTKAYNRRYFDHQIILELQRSQRNGYPISLAFVDADKFKSINDTHGHHIGDLVLQGLSEILRRQTRSVDIVARYGGEEFVVLMPNTNGEQAAQRMQDILEFVRINPIAKHNEKEYFVTFSCGVAQWITNMPVFDWVKLADEGVYAAKEQGRNRVILSKVKENHQAIDNNKTLIAVVIGSKHVAELIRTEEFNIPLSVFEFDKYEEAVFQETDICILALQKELEPERFKKFREEKLPRDCKVLLVTETRSEKDVLQSIEAGIDGYIRSPFSDIDLEISVKRLIYSN